MMAQISAARAATDIPCSAGETVDGVADADDEAGGSFPESALFFDILPVLGEACLDARADCPCLDADNDCRLAWPFKLPT